MWKNEVMLDRVSSLCTVVVDKFWGINTQVVKMVFEELDM